MPTTVSVDVYARDRASQTFDKVGRAAHSSGGLVGKFGTTVAGVFTGAALYNGARDLVHVLGDLGESAAQDEAAARRMALQFKNSAGATKGQVAATEDWITAQGKALGISDDELRPALTRAITATHNVADAQKQVALAMDVSASKGKSLQTVEEALAKGAQGNTAGLSRLGVQIKDADGKTRSLSDITKDLAKTYSGQAAAAADTTAGRYARLKVQISETGEAIGYKLLPYAVDFGEWALNKGLPALQDFGGYLQDELGPTVNDMRHWFSQNEDELKDFAKVVGGDVLTGLKDVAHVGGEVVGFLNGLPDPVKRAGVEIAVAAFALRQFNNALSPIGRNLSTFASGMASAEGRATALAAASRQAAGVGGLALLIDSTRQSNDAISTLEGTAGAAAAGFAVGGPWGAAIGGAGGLVYELGSKFAMADRKAQDAYDQISKVDPVKEAEKSLDDLKSSLDQVTGAYTGATRAAVLQKLEQAGLIETGQKYGLTTRQMIDGAIGQQGAFAALKPVVKDYQGQLSELDAQIKAVKDSNESYTYGDKDTNVAFRKLTDSATEQVAALEKNKKALQTHLEELKQLPGTLKKDADEIRATSAATADYTGKLKGIPASAKTQILTDGLEPTIRAVADLTDHYNLTPKQVKTLIQATGVDASVRQVENLKAHIDALRDKTVVVNVRTVHSSAVAHGIGTTVDGPVDRTPVNRTTNRSGPVSGNYFGLGQNTLASSGAALLGSLVAGLTSGKKPLDRVLDAIHNDVQTKLDFRDALVSAKASFAASFADWQTSIFATAGVDDQPVTLDQILAASGAQLAKSQSVNADVQKLIAMGLSDDLIKQMQANGAQGEDAIHALTTASVQQIAQLNEQNAATQANLTAAGTAAASKVYDGQIAVANQVLTLAQQTAAAVQALQQWGEHLRLTLQGDELVAVLAKEKKDKGKQ